MNRSSLNTFLVAWLPAWGIVVFLSSAIIAWRGLTESAGGAGLEAMISGTWPVADLVSPAAKLSIGGMLLAGFLALARWRPSGLLAVIVGVAIGLLAMVVPLALLPIDLSRGFGAGLAGLRFDPDLSAAYLAAAVVGGGYGGWVLRRR